MSKRKHDQISTGPVEEAPGPSPHKKTGFLTFSGTVTRWVRSEVLETYPPMPAILDPKVEEEVLTHPAWSPVVGAPNYDRAEWLGDALLQTIASVILFQTFPTISPGRLSQLRELCVKNSTLAKFTRHYGLDKRAKLPHDWDKVKPDGRNQWSAKEKEKVLGDMFESYVGGVVTADPEKGFERATKWLKPIWGIVLKDRILEEERRVSGKDKGPVTDEKKRQNFTPKEQLMRTIGAKGIHIYYEEKTPKKAIKDKVSNLPLFRMACYLTGWGYTNYFLGQGDALSKGEASHRAAERALENRTLMEELKTKKADFAALMERQARESSQE